MNGPTRDTNPWQLPPISAVSQQGLLANPSPSLNWALALILLSQICAEMRWADVPAFKLRSWQLISATTPLGNPTLSPGKQFQKHWNYSYGKKKNKQTTVTPEYQRHLKGDKGVRTSVFCVDANKPVASDNSALLSKRSSVSTQHMPLLLKRNFSCLFSWKRPAVQHTITHYS